MCHHVPNQAKAHADVALDPLAQRLVEGNQRCRSWREKLDWVRELLTQATELSTSHLVDLAVYLRFLGVGEIPCAEDGRHFRPVHHARLARQIQERLAALRTPDNAWLLRKIYPWLPSTAQQFQRAEPLTRIRDIAHRNDIPSELKREIKHTLQNKLHRCAGPEDLLTATALLARVTAPGAVYPPAFVEQFRIFHEELKEFFNARSLADRLRALLPAVGSPIARLIHQWLELSATVDAGASLAQLQTLTQLRQGLQATAGQVPMAEQPDFVLADIGLEDVAFARLSALLNEWDKADTGAAWESWLEALQLTLANLALSEVEMGECQVVQAELRAWQPLDPNDPEQLLRLKATVTRARRMAESYSGRILTLVSPRAMALGLALGVPEASARIFAEAEIRGHLVFQLSKLATLWLRRLRSALRQPAWEVVVCGRATGRVTRQARLHEHFTEPTWVLLDEAEGDEDLPPGIVGMALARDLPHLSHLAVRARQAGVVVVVCEDAASFADLSRFEGQLLFLDASPERVTWQPATAESSPAAPGPRALRLPQVRLQPAAVVSLEHASPECGGNKAAGVRRLTELAKQAGADFQTPPALVIPFGVLPAIVASTPGISDEYQRLVASVNGSAAGLAAAEQLGALIETLMLPDALLAEAAAPFGRHARLMVRSSANDEDLAMLAGAGLYESVANVGPTEIASAVRAVWASLWSRRAVLSREQAGVPQTHAHMAVLLQQMLAPDYSFILHTVNPQNRHREQVYAEIVVGMGETLASAAVRGNPYRWVCDRRTGVVTPLAFANYSDAQVPDPAGGLALRPVDYSRVELSRERAARAELGQRLAALAGVVESAFGGPQDIEGVVKGGHIYLVQSRPQQGLED